jgi:DNA-binding winged helix-turn-helix (wHTH) protein/tetratricopeptide (TPR) repeat protein
MLTYRFGPFALDAASYRLTRDGTVVPLSHKALDLLLYLVARPSALVGKQELLDALWPGVAVTENALTQAVSDLRQALGDDPSQSTYLQTVPRRGYRFIAPVESASARTSPETTPVATRARPAVAVLDFANASAEGEVAWLASGIAETVTNGLRLAGNLRIIDRLRVVETVRRVGTDLRALRAELGIDFAVVGAFQRAGERLRLTARVTDARTGEATADAKVDGTLEQVFEVQDRLVTQLVDALGETSAEPAGQRVQRETSSLEAYQAFTEGRIRLESLEAALVPAAIADFERAVVLDPRYALAHVNLGLARFWLYEASRAQNRRDAALLARAIEPVRRAIELEDDLAEAHATLSYLLVGAGRFEEAGQAARRAVSLEAGFWGHHYRLGHAVWGEERLRALGRAMELYPHFPFAHLEAAMVHIARGALDRAESVLREGARGQDRQADLHERFPAKGLHWMLGLVRLARGDLGEARVEFEREIGAGTTQLYAAEFTMNAWGGLGFVALHARQAAEAAAMFERGLERFPEHTRLLTGLAAALLAQGDMRSVDDVFERTTAAVETLRRNGRAADACLAEAFQHTVRGRHTEAVEAFRRLVELPSPPFAGWSVPVEPLLAPLRTQPGFDAVAARLAENAR